jgi:CelD/BcsL family acetyltransferase involved in cellulose biosynthesis
LRAARLSALDVGWMRAEQSALAAFQRTVSESPCIDLKNGFAAYAAELRAERRNVVIKTQSDARRLVRASGPLHFRFHDPSLNSLHQVIQWKRQQYQRTGVRDIFLDRSVGRLLETVHRTQMPGFAGVLSTLWAGETLVAGHIGMRSTSTLHWWFPAYDPAYGKMAPGRIMLLEISRSAPAAGILKIELGQGAEDYKRRFANDAVLMSSGYIGSSPRLRLRYASRTARAYAGRWETLIRGSIRWSNRLRRGLHGILPRR